MFAGNGDEPGAGNAGAHRVRRGGEGASNSPNQPLAQIPNPKSRDAIARFLLAEALALGISVGTDYLLTRRATP